MAEVIRLMDANQTSGLPVVNGTGDLVGFVSDGDVASYLGKTEIALVDSHAAEWLPLHRRRGRRHAPARAHGPQRHGRGHPPRDLRRGHDAGGRGVRPVRRKRIKKVPVVENGKLVGALSRRNIMRSLVEAIDILEK